MMRRLFSIFIVFVLCMLFAIPISAANTNAPTRVIHVVYDDSGSMYAGQDTWSKAKYSMEVFAAMLGETDRMNVYFMSDYQSGTTANARITLDGKDGSNANVSKIHGETTRAGDTPFDSVVKAYSDLNKVSADEKWLVVLTDGAFEDGALAKNEIDQFFSQKPDDIQVIFLGIGPDAAGITDKPSHGIHNVEAKTSSQILNRITDICTRVFNSNKLDVNVDKGSFSFDVPMSELIVFAQGANVSIGGIEGKDGSSARSAKELVEVKYSECDAINFDSMPDTGLLGKIATFRDDFPADEYVAEVTGAETLEIYYKPNIEVAAYLKDSDGHDVSDTSNLEAGEYTVSFGFVKAGTNEAVPYSTLLGDVSYEAFVTNNGVRDDKSYSSGDTLTLTEGTVEIDVTAYYLDYNSVSTNLTFNIFNNKSIGFQVIDNPTYVVDSDGFKEEEYIRIEAKIDGEKLTREQWDVMDIPRMHIDTSKKDFKLGEPTVEKTEEIGIFRVKPNLPNGKPTTGTYSDCPYTFTLEQKVNDETWSGEMASSLQMQDMRSWWERNYDLFIKLIVLAIIVLFLAGYLPWFKNYLPRSLKNRPLIRCVPDELGVDPQTLSGRVEKSLMSTIIPYVSQTAKIRYVPMGVAGFPKMEVRALRGRRMMRLTNINSFARKDNITFDGETIDKESKRFDISAGVTIVATRPGWRYTCNPNQE
ncbi:MAG: VWA domain-containing protein [Clostridiaceae bacterium]|nr:VWA domain-containing protein [Clostridiaceae bacterium]